MALKVYSTLSGQKEEFKPFSEEQVTMYVCGPTVYDSSHIGHAMSAVVFDVIRRYLEFQGYKVRHAMNFTDVDDKIINRANKEEVDWHTLTEKYINEFLEGIDALNVQRASVYPRATEEIGNIIAAVAELVEKGAAYPVEGDVYYRISAAQEYGALKHQSLEDLRAGERVEVDSRKENALDFALWKAAKPGEPSWESPWGLGRPGWHIECSAMALRHLGARLDIHGGGADLIFPHHSNEIAQSESLTGARPFVKYWLHNGLLQFGSDKMSKSLKNFVTIQEILKMGDPDNLRMFVLNSVYRNPLNYSPENFEAAGRGLQRLKAVFDPTQQWGDPTATQGNPEANQTLQQEIESVRPDFIEAMDDDFNSPQAMACLFDLVKEIHKGRDAGASPALLHLARETLAELGGVLGLRLKEVNHATGPTDCGPFINLLISTRRELRAVKQFALADKIRQNLKELGVTLEDRADGTSWKFEK
ncbi:MAG: cysteine--tRNA ligase [Chloroflexi bacterium]|nr:cysteine--tRNA ligase [Chloroflexota bacterium]